MFANVMVVLDQFVEQLLLEICRFRGKPGHALEHIHHEVPAVQVVQDGHVEGRGDRALLLLAVHVEIVVVAAPIGQAVDQRWVPVPGKDHRLVGGEHLVEVGIIQAMRVQAA